MISFITEILTFMYSFYDSVFQPVLGLGPYWSLLLFSSALALVFSLIYKVLLDIDKQKEIKEKINNYQEKMKEARENDKEDKASKHMKKTLELNQKMMMLNFKPMIATMVFVALIFPWLGSTFSPAVELNEQQNNSYTGELQFGGQTLPITVENNSETVAIANGDNKSIGESIKFQGIDWEVYRIGEQNGWFTTKEGKILKLRAEFVSLPFSIPLAGDVLNWLGFYIIIAMPLTFGFRKLLGVS